MSDLVVNPKTGFLTSRLNCHQPFIKPCLTNGLSHHYNLDDYIFVFRGIRSNFSFEPRCEKTGLLGFRPGPTQTRLCSHRRWLQTWNFVFRKRRDCTIRVGKTKALISFAVTAKLICVFVFAYAKIRFSHVAAHFIFRWNSCKQTEQMVGCILQRDILGYSVFLCPLKRRLHIYVLKHIKADVSWIH